MPDGPLNLTADECTFVAVYAETCDRVRAVEVAYPDCPPMERHHHATTVLSRPHVDAIVRQVRAQALDRIGLTINDVIAGLFRVIDDPAAKPSDRIAAWRTIAKVGGLEAPRQHRVTLGPVPEPAPTLSPALVEQIQRRILGLPPEGGAGIVDAEVIKP